MEPGTGAAAAGHDAAGADALWAAAATAAAILSANGTAVWITGCPATDDGPAATVPAAVRTNQSDATADDAGGDVRTVRSDAPDASRKGSTIATPAATRATASSAVGDGISEATLRYFSAISGATEN